MSRKINRRNFLKIFGGGVVATSATLTACTGKGNKTTASDQEPPKDKMVYRTNPNSGDRVSLLGYGMMRLPVVGGSERDNGMMRLPTVGGSSAREGKDEIDQEQVNRLVDYAIEHGVNYFDTSPAYCQGLSEHSTGIALHRHPRDKYFVATKLSNFSPETWKLEASQEMFENSLKYLQVDYIDYLLLHAIGGSGMDEFNRRFMDNGLLDWLVEQKEKGRIRNLGFSYHGAVSVFDQLLQ